MEFPGHTESVVLRNCRTLSNVSVLFYALMKMHENFTNTRSWAALGIVFIKGM